MKILIASDIHGDIEATRRILDIFDKLGCEKLLLLGDILYHGPRNNLPEAYSPKEAIGLLNKRAADIVAVKGNCDADVESMVLAFPIESYYHILYPDGLTVFVTHGHKFNTGMPPRINEGYILLHGHTHIPTIERFGDGNVYINPGSVSMPKCDNPKTFAVYENRTFTIYRLDGTVFDSITL